MTKLIQKTAIFTAFIAGTSAHAGTKFENARIYLPVTGSRATAGYAVIKNDGKQEAKVTAVTASGFKAAEIHETFEKDGKMGMKKMESLTVAAGGSEELKPGGKHIMLFEPTREFKDGEEVSLTLTVDGKPVQANFKMTPRPTGAHHH